jgi:HbrB-like
MDRIDESRISFSSDGEGSDSELSPVGDSRLPTDWNHSNPRSGTIPGGQFELPVATASTATTTPLQPPALRERTLSATDALFQSSRKRASSEADKTKPVKEGGRRTLFSRPSKIMTNFAGGGKDKDRNKPVEKDESPISPTYFRPFASPSNLRPRHSHDETHRNLSLGNLSLTSSAATTPGETSHTMLSPAGVTTPVSSSSLRPQLFHRARERKDSNPSSVLSVSTVLSKQNSSESNLSHSPASPSLFQGMERVQGAMPKSISTQDIRQANAGHYSSDAVVMDDPWPLLRARGLGLFHGEGMRINIEDLNKLVM